MADDTDHTQSSQNTPQARGPVQADESAPVEESRIVVRPNGEVVIENLSELLLEVAEELDPEMQELLCMLQPKAGEEQG
ncbi:MAG: hypothetical protein KC561_00090 [Myxococcales bacterium]|nr:hypothetical protein [Myxococcales bacterium]